MPTITPTTVEELLDYWSENIPFKGGFVSDDGCMCAHAQALFFLDNYSLSNLHKIDQVTANDRVAELFGISRSHSALLRIINDKQDGAPSSVIRNPKQILGSQAQIVLALWRHLDRMTAADWDAAQAVAGTGTVADANADAALTLAFTAAADADVRTVRATAADRKATVNADAWVVVQAVSGGVVNNAVARTKSWVDRVAARIARMDIAWAVARIAAGASGEIQGAAVMRKKEQPFFFLPLLGFADPEAVVAADSN